MIICSRRDTEEIHSKDPIQVFSAGFRRCGNCSVGGDCNKDISGRCEKGGHRFVKSVNLCSLSHSDMTENKGLTTI